MGSPAAENELETLRNRRGWRSGTMGCRHRLRHDLLLPLLRANVGYTQSRNTAETITRTALHEGTFFHLSPRLQTLDTEAVALLPAETNISARVSDSVRVRGPRYEGGLTTPAGSDSGNAVTWQTPPYSVRIKLRPWGRTSRGCAWGWAQHWNQCIHNLRRRSPATPLYHLSNFLSSFSCIATDWGHFARIYF